MSPRLPKQSQVDCKASPIGNPRKLENGFRGLNGSGFLGFRVQGLGVCGVQGFRGFRV